MSMYYLYKQTALTMSEILTTADSAEVLRELLPAQNKYYNLGLALGLAEHEVDGIRSTYRRPEECLREVIIKFLQQTSESKRNWRFIAGALSDRLVSHQVLAGRVKAAHFPDPTSIVESDPGDLVNGDVPSDTSGMCLNHIIDILSSA